MILIKHPKYRVKAYELIDSGVRNFVEQELKRLLTLYRFKEFISDIQIIGSYGTGCAELYSDLDVNFLAQDDNSQEIILKLTNNRPLADIKSEIYRSSDYLEVNLDIVMFRFSEWENYSRFSLNQQKLLGRVPGQYYSYEHRKLDVGGDYRRIPRIPRKFEIVEDPYCLEVVNYTNKYGKELQCL